MMFFKWLRNFFNIIHDYIYMYIKILLHIIGDINPFFTPVHD